MVRRILKVLAVAIVALIAGAVLLYQFGLRFVMDGGGIPRPQFVETRDRQAERIEEHRAAQRAAAPAVESIGAATPATEPASAAPGVDAHGAAAAAASAPAAPYWTDFRGPLRDGDYRDVPILQEWPAGGLKPMWKQPAGGGYASFVVARGRAFTIEQRGGQEVAAAYDVATGRELWTNAWAAEFRESMGGDGPRATPTWSDGRVYA
ncbi:MAG TPA: hypothetical protein VFO58_12685, partial [Vicinamibacterales bacterium]|nr:hypothetical protein [Vicinamibacterales bacterium]